MTGGQAGLVPGAISPDAKIAARAKNFINENGEEADKIPRPYQLGAGAKIF